MITMVHSQFLVLPQLVLLRIFGVWPARIKQLEQRNITSIIVTTYSIILLMLSLYQAFMKTYISVTTSTSLVYDISALSPAVIDFLTKITICQIAIFRYSAFQKCSLGVFDRCLNKSHVFLTLFVTSVQVGLVLWVAYCLAKYYFSNLTPTLHHYQSGGLTGSNVEAYCLIAVQIVLATFRSTYFPTTLILGHCLAMSEGFEEIKNTLAQETESNKIYSESKNSLQTVKKKYITLCNLSSKLDNTFAYYITFLTLSLGVEIFSSVYFHSTMSCMNQGMTIYFLYLLLQFLAFFCPCLGGSLIHDAVSTNTTTSSV